MGNQDTSGNAATATKIATINNDNIMLKNGNETITGIKTFDKHAGVVNLRDSNRWKKETDGTGKETIVANQTGSYEGHIYINFETKNANNYGAITNGNYQHAENEISRKGYIGIPANNSKKISIFNEFGDSGLLDLQNGGLVIKCDANKNTGIGTSNPETKLHVKQTNSATDCILTIEADGGTGPDVDGNLPLTGIEFKSNDGNPSDPTDVEETYTTSKILSGWNSGEEQYNESFFKVQTYHANPPPYPASLEFKDTLVIKGPDIGIGTDTPQAPLHIQKKNIESTETPQRLLLLEGQTTEDFANTDDGGVFVELISKNSNPVQYGGSLQHFYPSAKIQLSCDASASSSNASEVNADLSFHLTDGSNYHGDPSGSNAHKDLGDQPYDDPELLALSKEKMRIKYNGNVGIGITNPTQKLEVDGRINSINSLKRYEIDFSSLSHDQFAPVIMDYSTNYYSDFVDGTNPFPGALYGMMKQIDFYIETPSGSRPNYPNFNFIKGTAIGGGHGDAAAGIAPVNVEYYMYDDDEWVMLGIFKGGKDFYGITIYLRGGYIPSLPADNYDESVKNPSAGKYVIYTHAPYCKGFINGGIRRRENFPILKYTSSGTTTAVTSRIYENVTIPGSHELRAPSERYLFTSSTDFTSSTNGNLDYVKPIAAQNFEQNGWTFAFYFKLDSGQLYNTTDNSATKKNIGIIQLHKNVGDNHVSYGADMDNSIDNTNGQGGISFAIGYNTLSDGTKKYVFYLAGGIELVDSQNNYPDIEDNEWYHVVITKQDSTTDPEIYINNKKYKASNDTGNIYDILSLNYSFDTGYVVGDGVRAYGFTAYITAVKQNNKYDVEYADGRGADADVPASELSPPRINLSHGHFKYPKINNKTSNNNNNITNFVGLLRMVYFINVGVTEQQVSDAYAQTEADLDNRGEFSRDTTINDNDITYYFPLDLNEFNKRSEIFNGPANRRTRVFSIGGSNLNSSTRTFKFNGDIICNNVGIGSTSPGNILLPGNSKFHIGSNNSNTATGTESITVLISGKHNDTGTAGTVFKIEGYDNDLAVTSSTLAATDAIIFENENGTEDYKLRARESTSNADFAHHFRGKIIANGSVVASSDQRIKTNIEDVPDNLGLQQVRDIPCRYYEYIDKNRGNHKVIGFIAQEVEKVLPNAISKITEIIPDFYKNLENISWNETTEDNKTKYKMSSELSDVFNIKYEFLVRDSEDKRFKHFKIFGNNDNTFTFEKKWKYVFCYGKEVDDFNIIDKNQIFALHHSAIQELDKTIETEKKKTSQLESKVTELQNENSQLKSQMEIILQRLAALENKN